MVAGLQPPGEEEVQVEHIGSSVVVDVGEQDASECEYWGVADRIGVNGFAAVIYSAVSHFFLSGSVGFRFGRAFLARRTTILSRFDELYESTFY